MICSQWNDNLRASHSELDASKLYIVAKVISANGSQTLEGSKGVLKMLKQTRLLLENNSSKFMPK
jgi:hypothetical protein